MLPDLTSIDAVFVVRLSAFNLPDVSSLSKRLISKFFKAIFPESAFNLSLFNFIVLSIDFPSNLTFPEIVVIFKFLL